jgi:cyclic-di-GMP-binding protein
MSRNPIANVHSLSDPKDCVTILSALSVLGNRQGPFTIEKLNELIEAETHFRALLKREQRVYFSAAADASSETQAGALAKHIQLVHSHFASAFQRYVMHHDSWSGAGEHVELLHRATALAVANFGALVKWSYFLHETMKSTSWSELHALYYLAEQEGFEQKALRLYEPGDGYHPSIQTLYLRALVLDIINPGSLSAAQIEIAESWLSEWCGDYSLEAQYLPRSHWIYVDLAEHSGFHIVTPGLQPETIRYLRADSLRTQIEDVKNELRNGRRYSGRGSEFDFPVEEHAALLSNIERLYQSILAKSGNRIEERTPAQNLEVEVVTGLAAIMEALGRDGTASSPGAGKGIGLGPGRSSAATRNEDSPPGIWKVHDFSSTGIGLLTDRNAGEQAALHNLIALRQRGAAHWALGAIVRKLTNRAEGQTLVGVEILSYRPLAVTLKRVDKTESAAIARALYVMGRDSDGKRDFLVLRQADFALRNVFEIPIRTIHYRVRLNRAVKKGPDWIALRFEVDNKR